MDSNHRPPPCQGGPFRRQKPWNQWLFGRFRAFRKPLWPAQSDQ